MRVGVRADQAPGLVVDAGEDDRSAVRAAELEAAADLGARPLRAFVRVTLPQSLAGIVAGSLLVFIPAVGEYVIPTLLGRTDQLMIGRVLSDEFFENRDWPVASAVALTIVSVGKIE